MQNEQFQEWLQFSNYQNLNPSPSIEKSETQLLMEQKIMEDKYLSQFLGSEESQQQQQSLIELLQKTQKEQKDNLQSQTNFTTESLQQLEKQYGVYSQQKKQLIFKNIHRQIMATIKQFITVDTLKNHYKKLSPLVFKIWKTILKSKMYSKEALILVFGAQKQNNANFDKYRELFKIKNVSDQEILVSQAQSRSIILQNFKGERFQQFLNFRKIQSINYLKMYIKHFLEELRNGGIKKRISKQYKIVKLQMEPEYQT